MTDSILSIKLWLYDQQFHPDVIGSVTAGISIGLALATRHPERATALHTSIVEAYKVRAAGDVLSYEIICMASGLGNDYWEDGDQRTEPERFADDLVLSLQEDPT